MRSQLIEKNSILLKFEKEVLSELCIKEETLSEIDCYKLIEELIQNSDQDTSASDLELMLQSLKESEAAQLIRMQLMQNIQLANILSEGFYKPKSLEEKSKHQEIPENETDFLGQEVKKIDIVNKNLKMLTANLKKYAVKYGKLPSEDQKTAQLIPDIKMSSLESNISPDTELMNFISQISVSLLPVDIADQKIIERFEHQSKEFKINDVEIIKRLFFVSEKILHTRHKLVFNNILIGKDAFAYFTNQLMLSTRISSLIFYRELVDSELWGLAQALKRNNSLRHLCIGNPSDSNRHITAVGARSLAEALEVNNKLISLDIPNSWSQLPLRIQVRMNFLLNRNKSEVNNSFHRITKEEEKLPDNNWTISHIEKILAESPRSNKIDLSSKNNEVLLGNDELIFFLDFLQVKSHVVTELNLNDNFIGDNGAERLTKYFEKNHLEELNISSNAIGREGTQKLAEMLKNSQSIRKLNLSSNPIDDSAAEYLADALKKNKTLTNLDLTNTFISKEGVNKFIEVLKSTNTTLRSLLLPPEVVADKELEIMDLIKRNVFIEIIKEKNDEEKYDIQEITTSSDESSMQSLLKSAKKMDEENPRLMEIARAFPNKVKNCTICVPVFLTGVTDTSILPDHDATQLLADIPRIDTNELLLLCSGVPFPLKLKNEADELRRILIDTKNPFSRTISSLNKKKSFLLSKKQSLLKDNETKHEVENFDKEEKYKVCETNVSETLSADKSEKQKEIDNNFSEIENILSGLKNKIENIEIEINKEIKSICKQSWETMSKSLDEKLNDEKSSISLMTKKLGVSVAKQAFDYFDQNIFYLPNFLNLTAHYMERNQRQNTQSIIPNYRKCVINIENRLGKLHFTTLVEGFKSQIVGPTSLVDSGLLADYSLCAKYYLDSDQDAEKLEPVLYTNKIDLTKNMFFAFCEKQLKKYRQLNNSPHVSSPLISGSLFKPTEKFFEKEGDNKQVQNDNVLIASFLCDVYAKMQVYLPTQPDFVKHLEKMAQLPNTPESGNKYLALEFLKLRVRGKTAFPSKLLDEMNILDIRTATWDQLLQCYQKIIEFEILLEKEASQSLKISI